MSSQSPNTQPETVIWSGSPSQKNNLGLFALCAAVVIALLVAATRTEGTPRMVAMLFVLLPVAIAAWRMITTSTQLFTLTDQRLKLRRGVFNRVTDDLELYRVKDSHFTQPFLQRLLGIGTITLRTTDDSSPVVVLSGMETPEPLWERIRALVEARRDAKGVREIDMNAEPGPH